MQSFVARFAVIASLALALAAFASGARSEPAPPGAAPDAVTEAVAASPAPGGPAKVVVGAYINDIQELDFRSNSYAVDLYVWFRWKPTADLNPSKTMEFMNRYASGRPTSATSSTMSRSRCLTAASMRSFAIRASSPPSSGWRNIPSTRKRCVVMEDTVAAADAQVYVADQNGGVTINPDITLPGFKVGKPELRVVERAYPTNFGDLAEPEATDYSRLMLTIPVTRPIIAMSIKTFVPIGLIVVCAALVFFVRPRYVEGRIGLGITALLTLVALQLTSSASLPDVDYLMMIDKVYLLAYLFIILALVRVVMTSWRGADPEVRGVDFAPRSHLGRRAAWCLSPGKHCRCLAGAQGGVTYRPAC